VKVWLFHATALLRWMCHPQREVQPRCQTST